MDGRQGGHRGDDRQAEDGSAGRRRRPDRRLDQRDRTRRVARPPDRHVRPVAAPLVHQREERLALPVHRRPPGQVFRHQPLPGRLPPDELCLGQPVRLEGGRAALLRSTSVRPVARGVGQGRGDRRLPLGILHAEALLRPRRVPTPGQPVDAVAVLSPRLHRRLHRHPPRPPCNASSTSSTPNAVVST